MKLSKLAKQLMEENPNISISDTLRILCAYSNMELNRELRRLGVKIKPTQQDSVISSEETNE